MVCAVFVMIVKRCWFPVSSFIITEIPHAREVTKVLYKGSSSSKSICMQSSYIVCSMRTVCFDNMQKCVS